MIPLRFGFAWLVSARCYFQITAAARRVRPPARMASGVEGVEIQAGFGPAAWQLVASLFPGIMTSCLPLGVFANLGASSAEPVGSAWDFNYLSCL